MDYMFFRVQFCHILWHIATFTVSFVISVRISKIVRFNILLGNCIFLEISKS